MKVKLVEIIWIIGIILSIAALFSIAPAEIALNAFVVSVAIFALVWIGIAKKNLSRGSSLGIFSLFLFSSISFFMLTSVTQILLRIFALDFLLWVMYICMSIAYLLLVVSSYKLMQIGKEFGFAPVTGKMKKMMKAKIDKIEKLKKETFKNKK